MNTAKQDLQRIQALHGQARQALAESRWEDAERAGAEALALDEQHAPSYDLMAEICEARQSADKAEEWRAKAGVIRKQVWQRQVEAEARGHHEVLGKPSRQEIP